MDDAAAPARGLTVLQTERAVAVGLRFRRDASGYVSLVHLYRAFGVAFLWGSYHQVLGPSLHLAKFANGLCRYSDVPFHLDTPLI